MKQLYILISLLFFVSILAAQNVGIGTPTPNQKLDVAGWVELGDQTEGTSGTAGAIRYHSTSKTIQYYDGTIWIDLLTASSAGDADWTISGNNMYNANAGNVGIGTTTYTEKVNIGGDLKVEGSGGTIGLSNVSNGAIVVDNTLGIDGNEIMFNIQANIGTVGAQDLIFHTSGLSRMTLQADGDLGIGITPAEKLHINGSVRGNQSGALRISTGTGYTDIGSKNTTWSHFYTDRPAYYFDQPIVVDDGAISSYDENLVIRADFDNTSTANQLFLETTGDVGVGAAPEYKLDVDGDIRARGADIYVGTSGERIYVTGDDLRLESNSGYIDFRPADGSHGLIIRDYTGASADWTGVRHVNNGSSDRFEFSVANGGYGSGLVLMQNNRVGIGLTNPSYDLHVSGKIKSDGITETSDKRLKKNIETLESALAKLLQLRGVSYNWRVDEYPELKLEDGKQLGVIAQEIEKLFPEVVNTDEQGYKSVEYSHLVPVLIEAIKSQHLIIEDYQATVDTHSKLIKNMQTQLNKLQDNKKDRSTLTSKR